MAESLGQARLDITVDLEGLEQGLRQARQLIEGQRLNLNVGTNTGTTQSQGRVLTPNVSAARPDSGAIAAERELAAARKQAAAATKQAISADKERSRSVQSGRLSNALSSGLIGGAFPLLFGQGAGASVGGLLGGVGGGLAGGGFGFGLSLVGTAIGAQFDAAIKKAQDLAAALKDPIGSFDQLKQSSLLSSKAVERNAQSLIEAGKAEEAAAVIRSDITSRFGNLDFAQQLNADIDDLSRSFSELGVSIAQGLAPGLSSAAASLAVFIRKLALLDVKAAGEVRQQALNFIGNDPQKIQEFSRIFQGLGGQFADPSDPKIGKVAFDSIGKAVEASRILLNNYGILTEQQELLKKSAQDVAAARQRSAELAAIEAQAIVANAAGDKEMLLLLEKRKLALQEIAALNAAPAGDDVKRDQIKLEFANRRLAIEQQIANLPVSGSLQAVQEQLQDLEQRRLRIDIDSEAFVNASVDIAAVRAQLDELDGRKAQVEVEVLQTGLSEGLLQQSFRNFQRLANELRTVAETASIGTPEFASAVDQYQLANDQLRIVSGILDGTFKDGADAIRQAGDKIRSVLESGTQFLYGNAVRQLAENALAELDFSVIDPRKAGLIGDPRVNQNPAGLIQDPGRVIQAAQFQRQLNAANAEFDQTAAAVANLEDSNGKLTNSLDVLNGSVSQLVQKNWNVNVSVNAGTGTSEVNLG